MCGIVGILGREPVAPALIEALKRLEYRGYDSAGVATLENGRLTRLRASGKLRNLQDKLERVAAVRPHRPRPHPLGDAWPPQRKQRAPARQRQGRGGP